MKRFKGSLNKLKFLFQIKMMTEVFLFILKFSGWAGLLYVVLDDRPKLKGTIMNVIVGTSNERGPQTVYSLYPYIANYSKNDIELLDFQLEIDFGEGYIPMEKNLIQSDLQEFRFSDSENNELKIPNWPAKQIYNKSLVAEFGQPLHGFISFKGPIENYNKSEKSFKLICMDVNGEQYIFRSDQTKMNLFLWKELAGVRGFEDYNIAK
jgi:hypothetical protein